jgi:hypothetical protein
MIVNLIAYRSNGDDSCMGCLVGRSDSSIVFFNTTDIEEAIVRMARINFDDKFTEREVNSHDFVVIIDGYVVINEVDGTWYPDDTSDEAYAKYDRYETDIRNGVAKYMKQMQDFKDKQDAAALFVLEKQKQQKLAYEAEQHRLYILSEYNKLT